MPYRRLSVFLYLIGQSPTVIRYSSWPDRPQTVIVMPLYSSNAALSISSR